MVYARPGGPACLTQRVIARAQLQGKRDLEGCGHSKSAQVPFDGAHLFERDFSVRPAMGAISLRLNVESVGKGGHGGGNRKVGRRILTSRHYTNRSLQIFNDDGRAVLFCTASDAKRSAPAFGEPSLLTKSWDIVQMRRIIHNVLPLALASLRR